MIHRPRALPLLGLCLLGVPLVMHVAGCRRLSDEPVRVVVTGSVSYRGKPVAKGEIRFVPTKESKGPVTIAKITDGQFRAEAKGGVPVATQRVEILGYAPDPKYKGQEQKRPPMFSADEWPPRLQYLPNKYNTESTLELIVASGQGDIHKDFDLQ